MGIPAASLPAPFSAGFAGGYETALMVVVHLGGGDALYMITKRGLTDAPYSLTVKYGSNTLTPFYDYYRPQYLAAEIDGRAVEGVGDIDLALNIDDNGGLSARGEARINLLNLPLNGQRLDWLLSMFDLENYDMEIWEGYIPLSGTLQIETDMLLRFRGVIRGGITYDTRVLTLAAIDRRDVENPKVPKYLVNRVDTPTADEHYVGKPNPMPCGDYLAENITAQTVGGATLYPWEMGIIHPLPTIRPGRAITFFLSDYEVPAMVVGDNPVFFRSPDAKNWCMLMLEVVGARGGYSFGTVSDRPYLAIRYPVADCFCFPSILGWNNSDAAFDEDDLDTLNNDDLSDYVTVAYPDVLSLGYDQVNPPADFVNAEDVQGGYGAAVDFVIVVITTNRTGNTNVKVYDRELGSTVDKGVIGADVLNTGYDMPTGQATFGKLSSFDIEIRPASGASLRVHKVLLVCRARPSLSFYAIKTTQRNTRYFGSTRSHPELSRDVITHTDGMFVAGQGAVFGSWITDGGRSVGYAPGDLITNGAYYIEFLLRNYVPASVGRIDTDSIDAIGNTTDGTRKDWNCKGVNREQRDVMEIIRQVAHEHGIKHVYDYNADTGTDYHRLITIPHRDDAVDLTITEAEIMADESGIAYLQRGNTPQTQISNAYVARYRYNFPLDDYSREIYIDDLNSDDTIESNFADDTGSPRLNSYLAWCEGSVALYQRRIQKRIEFDYIDDAATAELRLKLYLDWYAYQRQTYRIRLLRTLDTVGIRLGDVVKIDHPLLNDLHQNVTKFVVDNLAYPPVGATFSPYIEIVVQEIPNQYTAQRVIRGLVTDPESMHVV